MNPSIGVICWEEDRRFGRVVLQVWLEGLQLLRSHRWSLLHHRLVETVRRTAPGHAKLRLSQRALVSLEELGDRHCSDRVATFVQNSLAGAMMLTFVAIADSVTHHRLWYEDA